MKKSSKIQNLIRRKNRVRSRVTGTSEKPRLTVSISLNHVSAQIIDDSKNHTIVTATTVGKKMDDKTMTEKATIIGVLI
jgi:large subunit ribosomal protein L18